MKLAIDEENIKRLLKEALLNLFEERQDIFYEIFVEVIEDVGLLQAIKEGEDSDYTSRDEVIASRDDVPRPVPPSA